MSQVDPSLGSRSKKRSVPCKQYGKLGAEDHHIYEYFSSYLLSSDQVSTLRSFAPQMASYCAFFPSDTLGAVEFWFNQSASLNVLLSLFTLTYIPYFTISTTL